MPAVEAGTAVLAGPPVGRAVVAPTVEDAPAVNIEAPLAARSPMFAVEGGSGGMGPAEEKVAEYLGNHMDVSRNPVWCPCFGTCSFSGFWKAGHAGTATPP